MAPTKRALIIASPFGGLSGPLNDAESMKSVLEKQGFEILECCNSAATRRGILDAWRRLIDATSDGDAVVIYYAGHGDIVRPQGSQGNDISEEEGEEEEVVVAAENGQKSSSSPFQVLIPMDYDQTTETDFRGILNLEISYMLRETTNKTQNVTVIIDCCHSGRLFRDTDTAGTPAKARTLRKPSYHNVADFLSHLRKEGHFNGELDIMGNPYAVRIAASTASQSAMEYPDSRGVWRGALTEALISVMELAHGHDVSWRTILSHVRRLVQARFPLQHPRAEGPANRLPFSVRHVVPASMQHLFLVNDMPVLQAGSLVGVQVGNVYSVMPLDAKYLAQGEELPEATVLAVTGFNAHAKLTTLPKWEGFLQQGALAVLKRENVQGLPVAFHGEVKGLKEALEQSKYLRYDNTVAEESVLATFNHDANDTITLCTPKGIRVMSQQIKGVQEVPSRAFTDIIQVAERFARAQRVLNLQQPAKKDKLTHNINIEIGTAKDGKSDRVLTNTTNSFTEGEHYYIKIENNGPNKVHISVFNINATGRVFSMTTNDPTGYEIPPYDSETLGDNGLGFDYIKGMPLSWPEEVGKKDNSPVEEQFLFILTSSPVDLTDLTDSVNHDLSVSRNAPPPPPKPARIRYDVRHFTYALHPLSAGQQPRGSFDDRAPSTEIIPSSSAPQLINNSEEQDIPAADIPGPDAIFFETGIDEPPHDSLVTAASRGFFGALTRVNRPCCVRIVNEHDDEITAVVSKYAPNRLLSGAGLNASLTGAGFDISTTTFAGPATKKTLAAKGRPGCEGVFPLWTRREGFGVITVYKGPEKTLFIENDRVPLGATAYFRNVPDLSIVEYGGRESKQ